MKGIITLCGSTRFKEEFLEANKWLTLGGWIVLMPGVFGHREFGPIAEMIKKQKVMLDKLHLEKITLSEAILVIDVDGYIGESTKKEIIFANDEHKAVYYLSTPDIIDTLNNS